MAMDYDMIHSDPRMDVYTKNKITDIASRLGGKFCPVCQELIEALINEEIFSMSDQIENLKDELETVKDGLIRESDMKDIAYESALEAFKDREKELHKEYLELHRAVENLHYFKDIKDQMINLATDINTQLMNVQGVVNKLASFLEKKKPLNLREEDNTAESLSKEVANTLNRIKTISLRRSE